MSRRLDRRTRQTAAHVKIPKCDDALWQTFLLEGFGNSHRVGKRTPSLSLGYSLSLIEGIGVKVRWFGVSDNRIDRTGFKLLKSQTVLCDGMP